MGNLETGFCGLDEYERYEMERLSEDQLCLDGLYTVMFRLRPWQNTWSAVKFPARVHDREHFRDGYHYVGFTIFNNETPDLHSNGIFQNGYWQPEHSNGLVVYAVGHDARTTPDGGYFIERPDSPSDDDESIRTGLSLPKELVGGRS